MNLKNYIEYQVIS